jgi:hypothetical protein
MYDNSSEEKKDAPLAPTFSTSNYVHDDREEEAVIAQLATVSEAEAGARFRQEEADAIHQVREYEATRREARVRHVKLEIAELDSE